MRTLAVTVLLLAAAAANAQPPKPVKFGPLSATPPADWKAEKPANLLRSAQFKLPSGEDGLAAADLAVFGEASPKVTEKFAEWRGTFALADGESADKLGKVETFALPGKTVAHTLDVTGTWKYRERPRDPASKEELRPEYRVVWAILVNEDETTHVRLSGPAKVVSTHHAAFVAWLKSAK